MDLRVRAALNAMEGRVVRLRPLAQNDPDRLAEWNQHPVVGLLAGATLAQGSHKAQREHFDGWGAKDDGAAGFRIETLQSSELVGAVHLRSVSPSTAELAITLGPDFTGRGYGSDALRLAVRFAHSEMNWHRVELMTSALNTRAIRAYEKAGFTAEGTLRHARNIGGVWEDLVVMGHVAGLD